ncbi:methyl-accepting chemotaxis protein [Paenibacillus endoradicis]|uniref:methyl-accepting chemotaxis protein n=1 Tax=Paenibacillus endoradicis TaxID=2972487 RepID=UPI0021591AE1|nr:methyl-accepting chemotaxis protein [Paenibacillus endoradicis]MCR8655776.1 methyl-accepting chemotaxis protein [Paenibacillus endoradicis]MCR8658102.1 methyl-accepting chemotaxis protein [Paenibacillus endoradicis]
MKNDKKVELKKDVVKSNVVAKYKTNPLQSVGIKLFLYIMGGILACVITMGTLAYNQSKGIIEGKASESSQQIVNQLGANLDNILKTYEEITLQLMVDNEFHKSVDVVVANEDEFSKFESIKALTTKLQSFIFGNASITGIALIPLDSNLNIITAGSSQLTKVERLAKEEWIQEAIDAAGRAVWLPSSPEAITHAGTTPSFGIARVIKNPTSSKAYYVLLLDVSTKGIQEQIDNVNLGSDSGISIVNSNNEYMTNADPKLVQSVAPFQINVDEEEKSTRETLSGIGEVLLIHKKLGYSDWYLTGQIPVNELVKDTVVIRQLTVSVAIAAAVIAIIISAIVMLTISRPLVQLRNLMNEGAKGDLTVRSKNNKRKDEIGQLSNSFDSMMIQITSLATQTKISADAVMVTAKTLTNASNKTAVSAKEIAIATEEIANGSTSLAVEAERGNDLTVMINDQMRQVLSANQEMVQSAYEVESASGKGTAYMAELIEKTGMTEEMTREMVEKVDSLKDSTRSIVQILDVLNAVTKQTNILSLNATIEAARAGTAGRGFMVVANEIRGLADQSTQSIDVVAQITDRIQSEIVETVEVLSKAYPMFQEQINSVKEANSIFVSVQGQMNHLISRLEDVTQSVNKLEASQTVLNEAMTNVSAVAQQSSATSEEVASLSNEQLSISDNLVTLSTELNEVSTKLKDSLAQFKVE